MTFDNESTLSFLFPPPSTIPPSALSAVHWPGATPESTDTLLNVLKENHEKWHVFFNEKKFHNHAAHRALAVYALGAEARVIKEMYEKDCGYEKKAFESPENITEDNFAEHLGDERYYAAYRRFFTEYVRHKGVNVTLDEFLFSKKYNLPASSITAPTPSPASKEEKKKKKHAENLQSLAYEGQAKGDSSHANETGHDGPHMLSRLLSGLLHPFIHTGHGVEFSLPGMVVEGLAQTAVTEAQCTPLLPDSLFHPSSSDGTSHSASGTDRDTDNDSPIRSATLLAENLHKSLDAALLIDPTSTAKPDITGDVQTQSHFPTTTRTQEHSTNRKDQMKQTRTHALTILHRISTSSSLNPPKDLTDEREIFDWTIEHHGKAIAELVSEWDVDVRNEKGLENMVEEIVWCVCLIYGVGGWTGRERVKGVFNADFFLMHLVTSSLFLPPMLQALPTSSQCVLLRGYFATAMAWYVVRGKPKFDIREFFSAPVRYEGEDNDRSAPNVWIPLLAPSILYNEEHIPKIFRALAHWGRLHGTKSKGFLCQVGDKGVQIVGKEVLDGTLFIRVAQLTIKRMGRSGKDGEGVFWDMNGFFA